MVWPKAFRVYWPNFIIVLLSVAMLVWTFQTGLDLGMDTSLSRLSWGRAQFSTALAISRPYRKSRRRTLPSLLYTNAWPSSSATAQSMTRGTSKTWMRPPCAWITAIASFSARRRLPRGPST